MQRHRKTFENGHETRAVLILIRGGQKKIFPLITVYFYYAAIRDVRIVVRNFREK
jgi:hypothetical protein